MMKQLFFSFFLVTAAMIFHSCETDDDLSNPFIGVWRDSSYENGSWEQVTFHADKTFQDRFFDNGKGVTYIESGIYDYSESTRTITWMIEDSDFETDRIGKRFVTGYRFLDDAVEMSTPFWDGEEIYTYYWR
jgi:hypothetical protein